MKYELIKKDDIAGSVDKIARYNDDDTISYIPTDPANSDYQAYLASLEAPTV
jgi:agmatine/peptidylarginine deiminase